MPQYFSDFQTSDFCVALGVWRVFYYTSDKKTLETIELKISHDYKVSLEVVIWESHREATGKRRKHCANSMLYLEDHRT